MTAEELRAYAVTETEGLSTVQYEMQQRLNLLLKAKNTCLHAAEMEKLALKILAIVPDDWLPIMHWSRRLSSNRILQH